jgi:outer membrane biosynthesis protein TonB
MKWKNRDAREEPPASAFWGSVLVHGVVVALAVGLSLARPEPLEFVTYEIDLVSPPRAQAEVEEEAPPVQELEIETPDETQPDPEDIPLPDPDPEPEPTPPEPDPEPEETPPETPPDSVPTETTTTEEPEEQPEETGEDIEVRMEGLRRDFPRYYGNIVRQIQRCFRPPNNLPAGLETTIYFVIRPDGTVTDVRFVERSGVNAFDYGAMEAIGGCASGRFGELPEDLPYERLPILFRFQPPGEFPGAAAPTTPSTLPDA